MQRVTRCQPNIGHGKALEPSNAWFNFLILRGGTAMQDAPGKLQAVADEPAARTSFDEADWLRRLRAQSPWATGLEISRDDQAFQSARKAACIKRWAEGKEAWNRWADAMSALGEEAKAAGVLEARTFVEVAGREKNSATRSYRALATADFEQHTFPPGDDFKDYVFPDAAGFGAATFPERDATDYDGRTFSFKGAKFRGPAWFGKAKFQGIEFIDVEFLDQAWFGDAMFSGEGTWFDGAQFKGSVLLLEETRLCCLFDGATFLGEVSFKRAKFLGAGEVRFDKTKFESFSQSFAHAEFSGGSVNFQGAVFRGLSTDFSGVRFTGGPVDFCGAKFLAEEALFAGTLFSDAAHFSVLQQATNEHEEPKMPEPIEFHHLADFSRAVFDGPVSFREARFKGRADFSSMHSKVGFSLAEANFASTPDFIEATFHQVPRLDNAVIAAPMMRKRSLEASEPRPRFFGLFAVAATPDEHARFRKLRSMASSAKDHQNEVRFNGYEIACRRFWVDRPWRDAGRFWLGWAYGKFSNYGQAIGRPFAAWGVTLVIFAFLYLALASETRPQVEMRPTPQAPQWVQEIGPWATRGWEIGEQVVMMALNKMPASSCHPSYNEALSKHDDPIKAQRFGQLQPTNAIVEAIILSFRNALIFDRTDVSRRMYGCLYGIQEKGGQDYPVIPPRVTLIATLHSLLSAVFIFLVGLGFRNMFRVK